MKEIKSQTKSYLNYCIHITSISQISQSTFHHGLNYTDGAFVGGVEGELDGAIVGILVGVNVGANVGEIVTSVGGIVGI